MKKRILPLLLALCLALTAASLVVLAAPEGDEIPASLRLSLTREDESTPITNQNKADIFGDGTASFTYLSAEEKGVLTLSGARLENSLDADGSPIEATDLSCLEIVLQGENVIRCTDVGIAADSLIFSGSGTLLIEPPADSPMIFTLPIDCNELTVQSPSIRAVGVSNALWTDRLAVADGSLTLICLSEDESDGAIGFLSSSPHLSLSEDRALITSSSASGANAVFTPIEDLAAIRSARCLKIFEKHAHCLCGGKAEHSHTQENWILWEETDSLPTAPGAYYLAKDLLLPSGSFSLPDGVSLCLNGNSLRGAQDSEVSADGSLLITDCKETGQINGFSFSSGSLLLNGARITGGTFHGPIRHEGVISGGIFYGPVSGGGVIEESARVDFVLDSLGGTAYEAQRILRGQKAEKPANPTQPGFLFESWQQNETPFDFSTPILEDTRLTALWSPCSHQGGKATCLSPARCEACGADYGEKDPEQHTNLLHFSAVAPTEKTEGRREFWRCEGCGRLFLDEEARQETTEAGLLLEKLPLTDDSFSPLWFALLPVAAGLGALLLKKRREIFQKS